MTKGRDDMITIGDATQFTSIEFVTGTDAGIMKFVEAYDQAEGGAIFIPAGDIDDWRPVDLDGKGPLYRASIPI